MRKTSSNATASRRQAMARQKRAERDQRRQQQRTPTPDVIFETAERGAQIRDRLHMDVEPHVRVTTRDPRVTDRTGEREARVPVDINLRVRGEGGTGTRAAGISQELRNELRGIQNQVAVLVERERAARTPEERGEAQRDITRMGELTERMMRRAGGLPEGERAMNSEVARKWLDVFEEGGEMHSTAINEFHNAWKNEMAASIYEDERAIESMQSTIKSFRGKGLGRIIRTIRHPGELSRLNRSLRAMQRGSAEFKQRVAAPSIVALEKAFLDYRIKGAQGGSLEEHEKAMQEFWMTMMEANKQHGIVHTYVKAREDFLKGVIWGKFLRQEARIIRRLGQPAPRPTRILLRNLVRNPFRSGEVINRFESSIRDYIPPSSELANMWGEVQRAQEARMARAGRLVDRAAE